MSTGGGPIDSSVAHIARVYDYWLGGKDNFAVDRHVGDLMREASPEVVEGVLGNRAFLARTVRYLAGERGIRQFLDIGTGLPAADNTHEVAQAVAPGSRVVYVDNDPIVLSHARALLTGAGTAYLDADLRDTGRILKEAAATLDFTRPIAVMLIAVLHCVPDEDEPAAIVARLVEAVPPGSFLALSHPAIDIHAGVREAAPKMNKLMDAQLTFRTYDQVAALFEGLDMVEPGVVRVPEWRPGSEAERANPAAVWGGVARKR
ncbi:SAM-dependent methyltransferase [Actinoplanes subtropicus]|uniref:SAM-dependent methyltransferase n=1 Tax=Actinoplanes subtropicus TaxID=543632 RepID=UPI0004C30E5E|nr:SAM-dependent methyltransferase [Actinoplanes subtropicus]